MYVTRHIDWLSITVPKSHDFRSVFPTLEFTRISNGHHGYGSLFCNLATDTLVETDSVDRSMGHSFRMSGESLQRFRQDQGADDNTLIARFWRYEGKASRIDLTINIHEGTLTPRKVQHAINAGTARSRASASRFIEGKNGDIQGDTFYIGSPTSDRQFRAYNKAAQLGIVDGEAWLRLELELRRLWANNALKSVAVNGTDKTVSGYMGDFLEWGNMEYQAALGDTSILPVDIPRRDSNRQRWLLGQVAQALAKELCVDEDFALKFWSSVGSEVAKLKSGR